MESGSCPKEMLYTFFLFLFLACGIMMGYEIGKERTWKKAWHNGYNSGYIHGKDFSFLEAGDAHESIIRFGRHGNTDVN